MSPIFGKYIPENKSSSGTRESGEEGEFEVVVVVSMGRMSTLWIAVQSHRHEFSLSGKRKVASSTTIISAQKG